MMKPQESTADFARACKIEALVLQYYLADVDVAALALSELEADDSRSDEAIAKVVADAVRRAR